MAEPVRGRRRALQLPLQVAAAALLAALTACAGARPPPAEPEPPAAATHTDDAALALAQRLVFAIGYDRLPQVAQLNFRSVFRTDGSDLFTVEHHWDLENQRDRIVWSEPGGPRFDAVLNIRSGVVYGYIDGVEAAGPLHDQLARVVRQRFAVDTQFLTLPMRLFSPDAHLVHGGTRTVDGQELEVLELYAEDVDRGVLRLFVDPVGFRVKRSEVGIGTRPAPRLGATWTAYRPVGPLLIPHEHVLDDGHRTRVLEDVVALRHVDHEQMLPRQAR